MPPEDPPAVETSRIGLSVEPLPDDVAEQLGIDAGVRVTAAEGAAAQAGIRSGDVVTRLDNREIADVDTLRRIVDDLPAGRSVPVLIIRGRVPTFLALRVPD
jgi:serine protease Do